MLRENEGSKNAAQCNTPSNGEASKGKKIIQAAWERRRNETEIRESEQNSKIKQKGEQKKIYIRTKTKRLLGLNKNSCQTGFKCFQLSRSVVDHFAVPV